MHPKMASGWLSLSFLQMWCAMEERTYSMADLETKENNYELKSKWSMQWEKVGNKLKLQNNSRWNDVFIFCKWNESDLMSSKPCVSFTCVTARGWQGLTNPSKLRGWYPPASWVSVLLCCILGDWGTCQKQRDEEKSSDENFEIEIHNS